MKKKSINGKYYLHRLKVLMLKHPHSSEWCPQYSFNQIPMAFFTEIKKILKSVCNHKRFQCSPVLRKKNKRPKKPNFKLYYTVIVVRQYGTLIKTEAWPKEHKRGLRNRPIYYQLMFNKGPLIGQNEEMIVSSIYGIGETGCPHVREWNWTFVLQYTQKSTQMD